MADIEYYEEDTPLEPQNEAQKASRVGSVVNWIGALVSVGLVVGMAVWAWQLTVRDVAGVPVIRALEGPMRVAPADPGGSQADHQGLAVNRIAEGQEAEPAADQIVLAPPPVELAVLDIMSSSRPEVRTTVAIAEPEQPITLFVDQDVLPDAPAEALTEVEAAAPVEDDTEDLMQVQSTTAAAIDTPPTPEAASAATLALINSLIEEETGVPVEAVADAAATRPAITVIPMSIPGVRASPRPASRPATARLASLSAPASEAATVSMASSGSAEIDASTLAEGTRLVQLGAFDDAETARTEWARLSRGFPDFFADRSRIVQPAMSGGRQFYRLRAHGFADLSDARRFCTTLLAQGAACIPVTVR